MKKYLLMTIMLLATTCATIRAQQIEGAWGGMLREEGKVMPVLFRLGWHSTLDLPSQNARGIPVVVTERTIATLKLKIPRMDATFEGVLFQGRIIGTFRIGSESLTLALTRGEPSAVRPQTPVRPFPYRTREVKFVSAGDTLRGTLTLPRDDGSPYPVVLLVSGAGLHDRDEESFEHRPFAVIADAFAREGIATLRYDDRGYGNDAGIAGSATTLTFRDDAAAGIDFLRQSGFFRVGVLGHGEGGTIAFMLAAEGRPDFIISMSGMAERGDTTLFRQNRAVLMAQGFDQRNAENQSYMALGKMRVNGGRWGRYFLDLDPAPYLRRVVCPTLALSGAKDVQVMSAPNVAIIRRCCPSAEIKVYPGLNYMLQHCTSGLPVEYNGIEETISPEVLKDMIGWIKGLTL